MPNTLRAHPDIMRQLPLVLFNAVWREIVLTALYGEAH